MNKQKKTLRNKIIDFLEDPDANWRLTDGKWLYCDITKYLGEEKTSTIYVHYDADKDIMSTVLRDYDKFIDRCRKNSHDVPPSKVLEEAETKVTYKGIDGEITHELIRSYLAVLTRLDVVNPMDQWPAWPSPLPVNLTPIPEPQDGEYETITTNNIKISWSSGTNISDKVTIVVDEDGNFEYK